MNSRKWFFAVILAGIAMALWAGSLWSSRREAHQLAAITKEAEQKYFYCESCQHLFRTSYRKVPPQPCPQCGKETAVRADRARCRACQTIFPFVLHQWPTAEKAQWESFLAKRNLTKEDALAYKKSMLSKIPTGEWTPNDKFPPLPAPSSCPKCGNTDPEKMEILDFPSQ